MGRSSRSHADENRARILQVASSLFRPHGVEAVGIADVMKVAGMIQGSFYKHFPSKGALPAEACALACEGAAENWRGVARHAATDGRNVGMNDYVGCRISTEQSTHALAHRRALLSLTGEEPPSEPETIPGVPERIRRATPTFRVGSYKAEVYQGFFNRR
jgi:AcrR family transcriptional regulator